jgi:hypothetical protein
MKLKSNCLIVLLLITCPILFAQKADRALYDITIYKTARSGNELTSKLIRIDSEGSIFLNNKKLDISFSIKQFTKEVNRYISKDAVEKSPGNNNPPSEAMSPESNKQVVFISIKFKDDVNREKNLVNKTSYEWGGVFNKDMIEYPLFNCLTEKERSVLINLLK